MCAISSVWSLLQILFAVLEQKLIGVLQCSFLFPLLFPSLSSSHSWGATVLRQTSLTGYQEIVCGKVGNSFLSQNTDVEIDLWKH